MERSFEIATKKCRRRQKKRSKIARFFRCYFICVGVFTTVYMMFRLLVLLLVEMANIV